MMLTWRYIADEIFSVLPDRELTPKCFCYGCYMNLNINEEQKVTRNLKLVITVLLDFPFYYLEEICVISDPVK